MTDRITRLNTTQSDFDSALAQLLAWDDSVDHQVNESVRHILHEVKTRGDAAVLEFTAKFDRLDVGSMAELEMDKSRLQAALDRIPQDQREGLEKAAERIRDYHERQNQQSWQYQDEDGTVLGQKVTPLDRAGLYVPGGKAAYPSSVLMNAIPAKVAGVSEVIMVVPTPDGVVNDMVLAAAAIAGVDRVFTIGGAQAVAALAYGTDTVPSVDKIVGPGNAYVAAAKRQVFGTVGIDMIAGPSEILVVADADNRPDFIAADLLSQAEHDTAAQSILITDDAGFADAVEAEVAKQLQALPRTAIAQESWQAHGAVITVAGLDDSLPLIDRIAPEHLELAVADPDALAQRVRNAGAIFLGRYTPEAIGDYLAGPNHVLPTARSARFSSGLSVLDFMKRSSLISCDAAVRLAQAEGLDAHAQSVALRLAANPEPT